ncbi:MAG TPA: hypothetical protein VKU39_04380 [Streptosporangiaceae bacterium]|nr:hypothetical protein [Streptosporangiaceae bacterium]
MSPPSGHADTAGGGPAAELWTYGGVRAGNGGKRVHAWIDPAGEELWFARTGAAAIGSHYTVSVTRREDGITLHGKPAYAGSDAEPGTCRALRAADAVAQATLAGLRAERSAARRNALDEAIAPLAELAGSLRTGAERDALAAYVIRKLHDARNPR